MVQSNLSEQDIILIHAWQKSKTLRKFIVAIGWASRDSEITPGMTTKAYNKTLALRKAGYHIKYFGRQGRPPKALNKVGPAEAKRILAEHGISEEQFATNKRIHTRRSNK